jgi:hypothetical protein
MANMKKCPVCGVSVKLVNLESHFGKVHPGQDVDASLTRGQAEELRAERAASRPPPSTKARAAVVVVALLVLAGVAFALYPQRSTSEPPTDAGILVTPLTWDFGDMPREVRTYTFIVKSVGEDPLKITSLATSCTCTTVTLYANGQESPRFGMHTSPSGWSAVLLPGQTGELTVYYDAGYHPDTTGPIQHIIYVRSNDLSNPEVEVEITANVVP